MPPVRRLPVLFRALDFEGTTKPVPTTICPARSERMTVGTCGVCQDFSRIELDDDGQPLLHCRGEDVLARPLEVRHVLRVPMACASLDTTIDDALPYFDLRRPREVLPILDASARPRGVAISGEIHGLVATGLDPRTALAAVMNDQVVRVTPFTSLKAAANARPPSAFRGVFVVATDGTFLGLVDAEDLARST